MTAENSGAIRTMPSHPANTRAALKTSAANYIKGHQRGRGQADRIALKRPAAPDQASPDKLFGALREDEREVQQKGGSSAWATGLPIRRPNRDDRTAR